MICSIERGVVIGDAEGYNVLACQQVFSSIYFIFISFILGGEGDPSAKGVFQGYLQQNLQYFQIKLSKIMKELCLKSNYNATI